MATSMGNGNRRLPPGVHCGARPDPVLIESQPTALEDSNQELEKLLEDEPRKDAEQDQCARADPAAEQRLRNHEAMCARKIDELVEDVKAYRDWEREQMRRALLRTEEGAPPKRRCVLTLEAASGSADKPRIEHTLAFDVPMGGEPLTLTLRARMEPEPDNVSTVGVPSVAGEGVTTSPVQHTTMATDTAVMPQPDFLQERDFDDYQAVYRQWREGHLELEDTVKKFGAEVAEFVQSQYAMGPVEGTLHARPTQMMDGDAAPIFAPLDSRERSAMVAPGAPRPTFGFFESMYGQ